jgi:hypothetical protein
MSDKWVSDKQRRIGGKNPRFGETIPIWPQRLVMLQVTAIYLGTGVYKVMTSDWSSGEIFESSLQGAWCRE